MLRRTVIFNQWPALEFLSSAYWFSPKNTSDTFCVFDLACTCEVSIVNRLPVTFQIFSNASVTNAWPSDLICIRRYIILPTDIGLVLAYKVKRISWNSYESISLPIFSVLFYFFSKFKHGGRFLTTVQNIYVDSGVSTFVVWLITV